MNSRRHPSHLLSTWQLVVRRIGAHWRLLSSVVVGVLLACSMMASTVIYFDALRNLALKSILDKMPEAEVNVILVTEKGPTNRSEYKTVTSIMVDQMNPLVGWMAKSIEQIGKSSVFALADPDDPDSVATAWDRDGRSNFIFIRDLGDHIQVHPGGRLPQTGILNSPGEPLGFEALVPADQAESFNIEVGDQIAAIATSEGSSPFVLVTVSGLFDLAPGDVALRDLDERVILRGTQINFRPLQFYISEDIYLDNLGPAFPKLDTIYAWHIEVDRTRLNARNSMEALVGITLVRNRLGSSLFAFEQITSIDKALREFERRHFFTKLPMLVAMILIVVVILYYIVMVASMVVARQRSEIVLLRSRGASPYQIFSVFLLEAGTLSFIAAIVGPLIAVFAIGLIGYTPAFSDLTDGSALPATMSSSSFGLSALGGILTLCALTIPAIQASRIGVTRYRQQSSRPTRQSWFQKYYLDIAILVVSAFMFRQLSEQGSVVATNIFGDRVVDQVLLAMPALVLLASAMVLLRLLPLMLSLASRFMVKWLPAGLALGLWQMARNPTHYARLSLLLILMAGLGIFVASVGGTLKLNYEERILYRTGSDMRVEGILSGPRGFTTPFIDQYKEIEGVTEAMGAYRGRAFDLSHTPGRSVSILGIDTKDFQEVAWYRQDFSDLSLQNLVDNLHHVEIPNGLAIPQNATHINAIVKTDRPYDSLEMILRVRDVNNRHFSYSFGNLNFYDQDEYGDQNLENDWATMSTSLHGKRLDTSNPWLLPVPPLQLVSIVVSERDDRKMLESGWILVDEITATIDNSDQVMLDSFEEAQNWSVLKTTPESVSDKVLYSKGMGKEGKNSVLFAWTRGRSMTSRGIYPGSIVTALPVLAGPKFLSDSGHEIGDEFEITVGGGQILARIIGTVDYFPTIDTVTEPWIVADLMSLVGISNIEATFAEMAVPNEAWLSIEDDFSDRVGLAEYLKTKGIPPEFFTSPVVHDQKGLLDLSRVDPLLDAGWRALLIVAFSTVLVLSCIGLLLHTYVSFRDREGQFALLRAVGFSLNQIATLVWIEQAIVVLTGLVLGTWMGGQVGSTIMTFLGHDDTGQRVLPPYTMDVDWITLLLTYSLIVAVFSSVIAAVVMVVKRLSLQKVLRFGE